MKLATFQRSSSETRPDAHVIAVISPSGDQVYCTDNQAQDMMEQVGLSFVSNHDPVLAPFGPGAYMRVSPEYSKRLVKDLECALQEWANYVNG